MLMYIYGEFQRIINSINVGTQYQGVCLFNY